MNSKRLSIEWSLLLFAALAFVIFGLERGIGEKLDLTLLDQGTAMMSGDPPDDIVLVTIDDRSLADVGTWPWDRQHFASLIEKVSAADPDVIVFDILLIEPSDPANDQALAAAIGNAGNLTLPHTFAPKLGEIDEIEPVFPLEPFASAAAGIGHVAVFPDSDGVVRRFSQHYLAQGKDFPHLALITENLRDGSDTKDPRQAIELAIFPIEPRGSFRTISASDVLSGATPDEFLRDKRVLIGATAQGLGDRYSVPNQAGRIMNGVEIQANMIAAVGKGELIPAISLKINTLILALSVIALMLVFWKATPRTSLIFAFGLMAALLIGGLIAVWIGQVWVRIAPAVLAIIIAYPLWGWRRLAMVSRFLEAEARTLRQSAETVRSYEGAGFDSVARQVSRVKLLTNEVKESLTFIRSVVEAAPDPMLVLDNQRQIVLANEKATLLFTSEAIEDGPQFPELLARIRARFDAESNELTLADGRAFLVADATLDAEAGSEVMILREVTDIRNAERQRQEMLEFLSHDMRSPQVAIIALTAKSDKALPETHRLARIEGQARRTLSLAENFVQIARLGYDGIRKEDADIGALLFEATDRIYPRAKRKGVAVETHISDDPVFCIIDPYAISRVIDNLLDNAVKFTPKGKTVTLSLYAENPETVAFSVADQGEGFSQDRSELPFARFGPNAQEAGHSVGLGLAYVKCAVDEHGGEIELDSQPGQGARITVRLPR